MTGATTFWMVWKAYGSAPTRQHFTEQAAKDEAERLAKETPGMAFYVLTATSACKVQAPTVWRELKPISQHPHDCQCDDCTIPF